MTRKEAFDEINRIQDEYVDELYDLINSSEYESIKRVNFTSPTGTGKTKMMSKLINKMPDYYFVITTLSKGQLHLQVRKYLIEDCNQENFTVYGSADYKINSKLEAQDIINRIPDNTKCIWLRDEGHIKTNRFDELLSNACFKVVNFSATNKSSDIKCNFTHTMMLRTVNQTNGTPKDAILKLLEIKKAHKGIKKYNPCAIFRCIAGNDNLHAEIVSLCEKHKLKYIDLNDDPYTMIQLCEDNNENDVIINKFKLNEGIDIRRAHILFMSSSPANNSTTIQAIGRCRRNALLYRNDIDILAPENKELLEKTRQCFVYYNDKGYKIDEDPDGELQYAFCDRISCEELKPNTTIHVENGQLTNGLYILELLGKTGDFDIIVDEETGFNIVRPTSEFYDEEKEIRNDYLYFSYDCPRNSIYYKKPGYKYYKVSINDIPKYPILPTVDEETGALNYDNGYRYFSNRKEEDALCEVSNEEISLFKELSKKYTKTYIYLKISEKDILSKVERLKIEKTKIKEYIENKEEQCKIDKNIVAKGKGAMTMARVKEEAQYLLDLLNINSVRIYDYDLSDYFKHPLSDYFSKDEILYLKYFFIKKIENQQVSLNPFLWEEGYAVFLKDAVRIKECYKELPEHDKITYYVLENNISKIYKGFSIKLRATCEYPESLKISRDNIISYFDTIEEFLTEEPSDNTRQLGAKYCLESIENCIKNTLDNLINSKVDIGNYKYSALQKPVTEEEEYLLDKKFLKCYWYRFSEEMTKKVLCNAQKSYIKITNDRESAIVGTDLMRPIKDINGKVVWVESKTVTSKVGGYNKFNRFISEKYEKELFEAKEQLFTGKNNFPLDKNCNSMIGYCVEYYSKYLVYGKSYLSEYIDENQFKHSEKQKYLVVRACMQKYKEMMVLSFGIGVSRFIKTTSEEQLLSGKYDDFVDIVSELGEKTADYVRKTLYFNNTSQNNIDPNLSIKHISGLADYITEDTILDVKVRNNIDDKCVRQVLGYHYLSTKRSDLHIRRVIVYDATSGRSVVVNINKNNLV